MKTIFMLCLSVSLIACAPQPVPPHIQQKVDAVPADHLPRYFMVERHGCRAGTPEENEACLEKVRREYLANELARKERNAQ